jgi:hypothetical protein
MHMSCVKSDFLDSVASQVQSVVEGNQAIFGVFEELGFELCAAYNV